MKIGKNSNNPSFTSIIQTKVCIKQAKSRNSKVYYEKIKFPSAEDTKKAITELRTILNAHQRTAFVASIRDEFSSHVRDYKFKNPIRNVPDSLMAKGTFSRAPIPGLTYLFTGFQEKALSQCGKRIGKAINKDKNNLNRFEEFDEYYSNMAAKFENTLDEIKQKPGQRVKGENEKSADTNYYKKVKELLSNSNLYVGDNINRDIPGAPMYLGKKLQMVINAVKNDKGKIEITDIKFVPCEPIQYELNFFKQSA